MKAEHINPFYNAIQDVFDMMMDLPVDKKGIKVVEQVNPSNDANIVLGVTGDLKGSIVFSFPKKMTLDMVEIMSGMKQEDLNAFVASALGEVANIIGGNAMTLLTKNNCVCDIVPPQIYIGSYQSMSTASDKGIAISLDTKIGEFELCMILKEKS